METNISVKITAISASTAIEQSTPPLRNRVAAAAQKTAHAVSTFFTTIAGNIKTAFTGLFDAIRHRFSVQNPVPGIVIEHEEKKEPVLVGRSEIASQTESVEEVAARAKPAPTKSRLKSALIVVAGLGAVIGGALASRYYLSGLDVCDISESLALRGQCARNEDLTKAFAYPMSDISDEPLSSQLYNGAANMGKTLMNGFSSSLAAAAGLFSRTATPKVDLDTQCVPEDRLAEEFRANHARSFRSDRPLNISAVNLH